MDLSEPLKGEGSAEGSLSCSNIRTVPKVAADLPQGFREKKPEYREICRPILRVTFIFA